VSIRGFARASPASSRAESAELDASQLAVVDLAEDVSAAVLGAPGSGKTTAVVELVAERVLGRGWDPSGVLVLTSSRIAATRLRDVVAVRLGVPTTGPMARTVNSFAFEIVREAARSAGAAPPRLLTGGEQDSDLADLLAGHLAESGGAGRGPDWPETLPPPVRALRQFRTELRELMMRATEYDVPPARLRELGAALGRPEWIAAADVIEEYLQVLGFSRQAQLDPAELARFAIEAIRSDAPGERVEALRLVIVDDFHEATESTIGILRALRARGVAIVAAGDPDVAANAFRGGEPHALGRLATVLGDPTVETLVLSTVHRHGPALRSFVTAITSRIGAASAGTQRAATSGGLDDGVPLARIEATSPARQWSAVARVLRERHLDGDVPWDSMAVIVRSGAHLEAIARALALAEVPTRLSAAGAPLREDPAALALLTVVDLGIGRRQLDSDSATEVLLGPFGGLDRLGLRRLRLALRAEELAGGGDRIADDLLVEALSGPGRLITIDHRVARTAGRVADTLARLRASDGSIEELLWTVWERSGLASEWYGQAIGSGITAAEAGRNLDGIVALFTAAKRFAERRPDASPALFLEGVLDADVPEDTLSPRQSSEAVLIATPSATVGLDFDTVVVAGLQDGAWPNLRPRGSLLGAQALVEAATGEATVPAGAPGAARITDARRQVLGDELRMFALAVSRARSRVILAAVSNDDEATSPFFGMLPPGTPLLESAAAAPLSLRGVTGLLRRTLLSPSADEATRSDAASSLAALAREGLPGADPTEWHGLLGTTTDRPLFDGEIVPVSPSAMTSVLESPLDWFLAYIAGGDSGVVANVGTLLHWAMETDVDGSVESLWTAVQSRWPELVFDAPWLAERQSRLARDLTAALAEYLADFTAAGKALVGAESRFELQVDGAQLRGSIDRVERSPDGSVQIVDLKTGSPITQQAKIDEHPQLSAYQLAYADGALDESLVGGGAHHAGGAKLLFIKQGKAGQLYREAVQSTLTADQLAEFRARIREAADRISASSFDGPAELPQFGFMDAPRLRLHRVPAVSSD
jgi:superfamily I DNA/RNA helicase/RecB family exonuclease